MQISCCIMVHYCNKPFSDDHDMYWYFNQVFEKANNFELIDSVELGGGTNNNGITELTYQSATGNRVTLRIDGGFPVPELAYFDMCADLPTTDFIAELVSAFSQYHNKKFYHELSAKSKSFRIDLYPDMLDPQFQELAHWDKLKLLVAAAERNQNMPLEDSIRLSLLESGLYTTAVTKLHIGEKILRLPDMCGCYKEDGVYYTCYTNERAEMMTKKHKDVGSFLLAICTMFSAL